MDPCQAQVSSYVAAGYAAENRAYADENSIKSLSML